MENTVYAAKQRAGLAQNTASPSYFESVPSLVDRADMVAERLQRFIDRFHGCSQVSQGQSTVATVPSGHIGQLSRLGGVISQLEAIVAEIDQIG